MKFMPQSSESSSRKEEKYLAAQEGVQKDINGALGFLLLRYHIQSLLCRLHDRLHMVYVMLACIVLQTMLFEAQRDTYESRMGGFQHFKDAERMVKVGSEIKFEFKEACRDLMSSAFSNLVWAEMVSSRDEHIASTADHSTLKLDLIEHVWGHVP